MKPGDLRFVRDASGVIVGWVRAGFLPDDVAAARVVGAHFFAGVLFGGLDVRPRGGSSFASEQAADAWVESTLRRLR